MLGKSSILASPFPLSLCTAPCPSSASAAPWSASVYQKYVSPLPHPSPFNHSHFLSQGDLKAIATAYPQFLVAKAQTIKGVAVGDRREAIETLQFAERGIVKTHFKTAKMEELTDIFEKMDRGELQGRIVLDLSG